MLTGKGTVLDTERTIEGIEARISKWEGTNKQRQKYTQI